MGFANKQGIVPWVVGTMLEAAWAPVLVFTAHMVAWRVLDLYHRFPDLDIPMHLAGGIAIAYWFHVASRRGSTCGVLGPYHRVTHCLLVFGMTCAAAVFWEFAEFLVDRYLKTHTQAGNLDDTLLDMLLGVVGCLVWLVVARLCGWLPRGQQG